MLLTRLQLKNYKMFRHVDLRDIPAVAVFVGVNGSGKTTLFDVFDFVRDSVSVGVRRALNIDSVVNLTQRGGFREMRTRGETGPVEIAMDFRAELDGSELPFSYLLHIGEDDDGEPVVERETLSYPLNGRETPVLSFQRGVGSVVINEAECLNGDSPKTEKETIKPFLPAVTHVCGPDRYKAAGVLRKFVGSWHLSNFQKNAARISLDMGDNKHLGGDNKHLGEIGQNLVGFFHFMQEKHSDAMRLTMEKMSRRVPGFSGARAEEGKDGKVRLVFNDAHWREPFGINQMSDGTLRMLGILSLLHDPEPHSLLCVEEPEKEVYPHLLEELVADFHRYAARSGGHVLVSTHSYELLNAAEPREVFLLEKSGGVTEIRCAGQDEKVRRLIDEGDMMGRLWRMDKLMEPLA